MNVADILLILLILLFGYLGWCRGFIFGVFSLITWIGSLVVAFFFYRPAAGWFIQTFGLSETWSRPLAYILIALFCIVLFNMTGQAISGRVPQKIHRQVINRAAGILPGLVEGSIIAAVTAVLFLILPLSAAAHSTLRDSSIAHFLASHVERAEVNLHEIFGEAVTRTLTHLTLALESNEVIYLGFTVTDAVPLPELEERMLELVNAERQAAGLEALSFDPVLRDVSRGHSAEMLARGYFGHITPEGLSSFDRLRKEEVTYLIAGENLAMAPSIQTAHSGLMNSPGHRANILRPQFQKAGIGILDGGRYGLMVTQTFRN